MNVKGFVTLLRRVIHSKYDTLIMVNHLMIQCYSLSNDSDIGLHYALFIPYEDPYQDDFYDRKMIIKPAEILKVYATGHAILLEKKKEIQAKPKEIKEECSFIEKNGYGELVFTYTVQDVTVDTEIYKVEEYPISPTNIMVQECLDSYTKLIEQIKLGGYCVVMDAIENGMMKSALEAIQIHYYTIRMKGKKIRIPLIKSMLAGNRDLDDFRISIQETNTKDLYLYTLQLTKKELTDTYFGYIQNF